jgi:TonB-linked SusC/RagA family outer membrane protein
MHFKTAIFMRHCEEYSYEACLSRKMQFTKLLLVMKLTAILLLSACITASAKTGAQTITLNEKNASLETVLKQIQKQTGYQFIYTVDVIQKAKPISIAVKSAAVETVLALCFKNQPLDYNIIDKLVVIKEKAKNADRDKDVTLSGVEVRPPIDIHGRIVNEKGEPVIASVQVKGTNKGTTTNDNGEFELKGVDDNATLVISGVSIETFEVKVNGRSELALNAKMRVENLNEVVINKGYYSTSQRLNTGNVSKVTSADIQKQPVSNVLEAIEGRMAGVQIQQTSGVSGSGINIDIRGRNSLRNSNTNNGNLPLYIVDGVPISSSSLDALSNVANQILPLMSPLNAIDPSDVESIEILKDADATAIYGSRGANGVVLITTKKGKPGRTKVDISFYTGAGKVADRMDLLNSEQYMEMRRQAYQNEGVTTYPVTSRDLRGVWDTTRYTDWQKVLIGGTAKTTNLQASVSGGNTNTQFLFGAGYFKQGTVFPGAFSDQKLSGHLSLFHTSENNRFTTTVSFNFLNDQNDQPTADPTNVSLTLAPVAPKIYNDDGTLNWQNGQWTNPIASLRKPYSLMSNNFVINTLLGYQILSGLTLKTSLGYTTNNLHQTNLNPIASQNPSAAPTGSASIADNSFISWIAEPQIEYQRKLGDGQLTALLGSTFQQNINQFNGVSAFGITSDALLENLSSGTSFAPRSNYAKYRYNAIFGRLNYTYADKYLLNITGRRDGSSRFGPGRQFANFGAIGAGWIFSNEHFFQRYLSFINYGKLRASYGTTGSDQIPDYGYLDTYASTTYSYNGGAGLLINRLFNPDYGWEENKKLEAAIELSFFNDRVYLTVSHYRNRSSNQLVGYPLPTITGQSSLPFYNLPATVQNTGWEFELRTVNVRTKDFQWTSSVNLTIPRNKLISFPNLASSNFVETLVVGQSIYGRRSFAYTGIDPQTGLYTYLDVNKDGSISSPADLINVKSAASRFFGGFQNNLSYKGFSLDFLFQFVKQSGNNYMSFFGSPGLFSNQPTVVLNRWQKPGDATDIQRYSTTGAGLAAFTLAANYGENRISDASFIRLKNLAISYSCNQRFLSKAGVKTLRVFVQGQNLLTITNYLGLDPETQSFQNIPPLQMLTAGVQVTF